jgi:hypothetical protein
MAYDLRFAAGLLVGHLGPQAAGTRISFGARPAVGRCSRCGARVGRCSRCGASQAGDQVGPSLGVAPCPPMRSQLEL